MLLGVTPLQTGLLVINKALRIRTKVELRLRLHV